MPFHSQNSFKYFDVQIWLVSLSELAVVEGMSLQCLGSWGQPTCQLLCTDPQPTLATPKQNILLHRISVQRSSIVSGCGACERVSSVGCGAARSGPEVLGTPLRAGDPGASPPLIWGRASPSAGVGATTPARKARTRTDSHSEG